MKLWIKSQTNKLIEVHNIQSNFKDVICLDAVEGLVILGKYATEERALQVLDKIQEYLETVNDVSQMVYRMPKE